jgi:DnaK suppressor protein
MEIEQTGNESARTVELDQSRFGRLSSLQRIDKHEFGLCLKCGEEIDPKRLEFDPTSPLCIECAENKER